MWYYYVVEYVIKETGQIANYQRPFTTWTELARLCREITKKRIDILTIKFYRYDNK